MKFFRYSVFAIPVLFVVVLVFAITEAREAARQSECQGHMNQLQLALRLYESKHGQFPPAFITGPDGTPWHSWRVLLLPFLEQEVVYEQYRFDEPWNGPNNSKLADQIHVGFFQCPSGPKDTLNTNYVVVVGNVTAFPGSNGTKIADIKDGPENTILLVEIGNSDIHWMEPRDLEFDSLMFQADPSKASSASVSSHHPSGPVVVFADRITTYRIQQPFSLPTLRAMLTIAGAEPVTKEELKGFDSALGGYLSEAID